MAKIPIILEPGRADGKLATSDAIFDENKEMFQSEINDIQDTLNSDNPNKPLSAKQGKVLKNLLDSKVIEAGSVPIDTEPIEGNITHLVNSDGLAKEFKKHNTAIIKGSVYDVSFYNNGAVFNSIQSLLSSSNLDTLIPVSVRHGGMSIRFIQGSVLNSDNKYVQYRLMGDSFTTDTIQWAIADESIYVENHEFIYVKTDTKGKILWAIKTNGSIYYGAGVPQQVIDYIDEQINVIKEGTESTDIDGINKIVEFLSDFSTSDTLKTLLDEKVDKEDGKGLIDEEYASTKSISDNSEYLELTVDNYNRVVEGIMSDGTKFIGGNAKIRGDLEIGVVTYKAVDSSEFLAAWVDNNNRIVFGIKEDGDIFFGRGIPSDIQKELVGLANDILKNSNDIKELKEGINLEVKLMKIIKADYVAVRTKLTATSDIIIKLVYHTLDGHLNFDCVYIGDNELSDSELMSKDYKIRDIRDSIGAIGISTFWFLYAQHGWTIPKMTVSTQSLTSEDIGSIWTDGSHRFFIGNVVSNIIYLLPELTYDESTGIYTASWNGTLPYPTNLTHVSGATHISAISGKSSRYDLPIQTVSSQRLIVDGMEITENGTYYCDDFVISEHVIGHSVGDTKVWFPTPIYGESLIDWDRTFIFKGSMCTFNVVMNVNNPFIINDYRGQIIQMPLQNGDYHSYTFIPKIKKLVNNHRVDLPFNSDDGTLSPNYVEALRNTTDLYDVNDQPDRCITYLKDGNNNYLVGVVGGCSLVRGLSMHSKRNIHVPNDSVSCTYGGVSTPNKFYPIILKSSGFTNSIVSNSFIDEFSSYYCWFDPNANDGQVFYYKDGNGYILYIHNQSAHDKLSINLPDFMEGMIVEDILEKTAGSYLLTEQVVSNRLFVKFDTTIDSANYIVVYLK